MERDPALGRFVLRPLFGWEHPEDSRLALDHGVPDIGGGGAYQGHVPRVVGVDLLPDELCPGPGLTESAPGKDQPDTPVPGRCCLLRPAPHSPVVEHRVLLLDGEVVEKLVLFANRQRHDLLADADGAQEVPWESKGMS